MMTPDPIAAARFEGWRAGVEQCLWLARAYTEGHDAEAVVRELEGLLRRNAPLPPGIEAPMSIPPTPNEAAKMDTSPTTKPA